MSHTADDKWERKQYIKKFESNTIKDGAVLDGAVLETYLDHKFQ